MGQPILIDGEARESQIICWRVKAVPRRWDGEISCRAWIGALEQITVHPVVPMSKGSKHKVRRIVMDGSRKTKEKARLDAYEPRLVEVQTTVLVKRDFPNQSLKIPLTRELLGLGIGGLDQGDKYSNAHAKVIVMIFDDHIEVWRPETLRRHLAGMERGRNG